MKFKQFIHPTKAKIYWTIIPLIIIAYIGYMFQQCKAMEGGACFSKLPNALVLDAILVIPIYLFICLIAWMFRKK